MSEAQTGRVSRLLGLSTTSPDSSEISNGKAIPRWGKKRVIFSALAPCEHLGRGGSPQIPCRERSWLLSPSGAVNEDALAVPTSRAGLQREISAGGSGWGGARPCHPHPHSCQHPGLWPAAEGGGQGGRLAGLGVMAKPQSLLGPGEEGRVDAWLRGTPSTVLLLSWVDLEARKAAPGPDCLNLSLARCSLVLRPQQAALPPRAPFSSPVKPASKHSLVLGP